MPQHPFPCLLLRPLTGPELTEALVVALEGTPASARIIRVFLGV